MRKLMGKENVMEEAIELLRCAIINCDNVKKIGVSLIGLVKAQIEAALKIIETST